MTDCVIRTVLFISVCLLYSVFCPLTKNEANHRRRKMSKGEKWKMALLSAWVLKLFEKFHFLMIFLALVHFKTCVIWLFSSFKTSLVTVHDSEMRTALSTSIVTLYCTLLHLYYNMKVINFNIIAWQNWKLHFWTSWQKKHKLCRYWRDKISMRFPHQWTANVPPSPPPFYFKTVWCIFYCDLAKNKTFTLLFVNEWFVRIYERPRMCVWVCICMNIIRLCAIV